MAHQQSLRSMYTPPPLKLDDARVLQAQQVVAGCRHTVRKNPVSGYCAGDVNCTGLTRRLASKIMPHLNDTNKAYNAQWFATKRRGGSSTALGKRLDREIHHLVNCIRDPTIDVQRLAAAGSALPGLEKRERDKMPACTFCNLQGQTYGRRTPGWHRWTRAYLSDMHRYGMRLIASQVPVAVPLRKIATEIDDFALDHNGDPVVIERKSGYADATGKPRKKSGNNTITIQVPGQEEDRVRLLSFRIHSIRCIDYRLVSAGSL